MNNRKIAVDMWERLYSEHVKYAKKNFGKDVKINIGWSADDNGASSKIYGHGTISSELNAPTKITFEEF